MPHYQPDTRIECDICGERSYDETLFRWETDTETGLDFLAHNDCLDEPKEG